MNLKRSHLKELVEFCGDNPNLVKTWVTNMTNKEIKTLEELKEYPMKNNYDYIISEKEYPNLRKFIDYYDHFNRKEVISLDDIIELLDQDYELNEDYRNKIIKELIDLKFGTMCFDW